MEKIKQQSNNSVLLTVRDLVVEYTSEGEVIHAVNGASFSLKRGKTLGLVGETGAGKTTIAKSIMRILPEFSASIKSGEINFDDANLIDAAESEMRRIRGKRISMIFQDPMTALNPVMRIGDQISEVVKLHNDISQHEAELRAKKMLETVGIPSARFEEYPHQFSGGMKQRVVIAIALACNPELLLADEPTTALDVTIQAQVLEMINKLKNDFNTSMILITHDLGIVADACDDVAVIYAGEIIEHGSLEDIFDHPLHPYTIGLFGAIPDLNADVERLSPILGLPPDPTNLPAGCRFNPRCPVVTESCRTESKQMIEFTPGHFCRCSNIKRQEA